LRGKACVLLVMRAEAHQRPRRTCGVDGFHRVKQKAAATYAELCWGRVGVRQGLEAADKGNRNSGSSEQACPRDCESDGCTDDAWKKKNVAQDQEKLKM
jgi:hypothetical protein